VEPWATRKLSARVELAQGIALLGEEFELAGSGHLKPEGLEKPGASAPGFLLG